jgi:dihydrofolate reductase
MLEVVYHVATSLDGYIATADGSVDWLSRFQAKGEDHGAAELHACVDALLLGRHTYEFALRLGHWPAPDKPSWVFTHQDLRVLHPSITLTRQSPAEVVALLTSRGYRQAWLMGGGKLAASFHMGGLISRYILSVFPVLLGSGIPALAPHASAPDMLQLVRATPFKSGVVQLTYEHAKTPNPATQPATDSPRRVCDRL